MPGLPSGGGSGGGYARKLVTGLTPGQSLPVTVGAGGAGGTVSGAAAQPGGTSSFGQVVSATGGSLNYLASTTQPQNGGRRPALALVATSISPARLVPPPYSIKVGWVQPLL